MIVRTTVKSIQDIMRQDVGVDGDAQRISQLTWLFFLKIIDDQDQELEITRELGAFVLSIYVVAVHALAIYGLVHIVLLP